MDIQKINSDIATIEKNLNNPLISEPMKDKLKAKLAALKSQLEDGAKQADAVAEKAEDAADSEKKRLENIISKIRKGLNNKLVPENAKPALRRQMEDAEAKIAAIEKEAKEATAAAKEVKAEVKEAVAQVDDAIADVKKGNKVKKGVISKVKGAAKKVVTEGKKRKTTATAHEKKYKDIIDELVALVKGNKKLSVVYKGASRDSLERDAARHALPPGKRVSKEGNIYYEGRRNRVDVTKRKRYPFFDEGGVLQEIPNNYKGMDSEQVWAAWYPHQKNHFLQDHAELMPQMDKLTHDETEEFCNQNSFQLTLDYLDKKDIDKDNFINALDQHIISGQYAKGGKVKQGNPQGEHYTEDADAQRGAKPVGYRFTEAFVNSRTGKRLKLSSNSKPTKEQIEKYLGAGVYAEARADHSDKNKRTKLADGGSIENQYEGMSPQQVWDAWTVEQREHFFEDNIHFFDAKKRDNYKMRTFSDLPPVPQSYIEEHVQRGQYAKGGKVQQGNPQGEHYTEDADAQRGAKPVGYRFTEAFVNGRTGKRLKLSSNSKPTKEQIEKYLGAGVYAEARADHSDKNKRTKLEDGGGVDLLMPIGTEIIIPNYGNDKNVKMKLKEIVPLSESDINSGLGKVSYKFVGSKGRSQFYPESKLRKKMEDGELICTYSEKMMEGGGAIGDGKNTYVAFYKGKQVDVKADTTLAAQNTAAKHFKAKKAYDVTVVLGMLGDKEVVHSTASLAKGGKVKAKKQAEPQGEHYTEGADAKRHAKPVGWRFTSKFLKSTAARSRGLKVTSKPTKADIDKYKDKQYPNGERYIYQETRADHSDKKKKDGL